MHLESSTTAWPNAQRHRGPVAMDVRSLSGSFDPPYFRAPSHLHGPCQEPCQETTLDARTESERRYRPTKSSSKYTRKMTGHISSACVHCKKKHLRCDSARPCARCVREDKCSSCVDVEHKKRGRPPLKAKSQSTQQVFHSGLGFLQEHFPNGSPAPWRASLESSNVSQRNAQPIGISNEYDMKRWPAETRALPHALYTDSTFPASGPTATVTPYNSFSSSFGDTAVDSEQMLRPGPSRTETFPFWGRSPQTMSYLRPESPYSIFPQTTQIDLSPEVATTKSPTAAGFQLPSIKLIPHDHVMPPTTTRQQQQSHAPYGTRHFTHHEMGNLAVPYLKRPTMDIRTILRSH